MQIIETPLKGLFIVQPKVFEDARGHFFESFRKDLFESLGFTTDFVQDNQSLSNHGIIRGLHFQKPPHAQDKLVRVIRGAVLDVVCDIRKSSPTYGQTYSALLSGDNYKMLLIPAGFAHGFETLEDGTIFTYKCTNYYHPESEGGIRWNSPDLEIPWHSRTPTLSAKDETLPYFSEFNSPFD